MIDNRTKQVDTPKITAHPGITEQTAQAVLPNHPTTPIELQSNHEEINRDYIDKVPTPTSGFAPTTDNTQSVR